MLHPSKPVQAAKNSEVQHLRERLCHDESLLQRECAANTVMAASLSQPDNCSFNICLQYLTECSAVAAQ
eukprot:640050-Pelagomonas_calceolata.AAC.1